MAQNLEMGIDTAVTPALHPQNVASLEEYDDETKVVLGSVVTAFDEAYQGIGKVFAAREAAKTNPTWNEAQQILHTSDLAEKVFKRAAAGFDRVANTLKTQIAALESELAAPVQARAAHTIAVEIRNYVRGLKADGKSAMDFVRQAIEAGDVDSASAVLGAPAYLSGITPDMQAILLRTWHEKQSPATAKRLRAAQAGLDLVGERSGLLFGQIEKAVGAPPHKVAALRNAKTAAERHFIANTP